MASNFGTVDVSLTGVKPWWASTTIVSLVILVLVNAAGRLGLGGEDVSRLIEGGVGTAFDLACVLAAIWGRWRARKAILSPLNPGHYVGPVVLVALLLLPLAAGCTPTPPYVAADRATYDAIAPEYRAYVAADAALTDAEKARRNRTIDTWGLRLSAATRPAAK